MSNISTQLKNAIARAKFEDPDIEAATVNAIEQLDSEITSAGYEPGTDVEAALTRLEETLDTTDAEHETHPAIVEDEEDDEGEFGGFEG